MKEKLFVITESEKSQIFDALNRHSTITAKQVLNGATELIESLKLMEIFELEELAEKSRVELEMQKLKEMEKKDDNTILS